MGKEPVSRHSVWKTIKRQVVLMARLMRDNRVPIWMRLIPIVGMVYLISPIELLPDVMLPFGFLDDFVVIVICLTLFMAIVPKPIVDDHLSWLDAADLTIDDLRDTRRLPPRKDKDKERK